MVELKYLGLKVKDAVTGFTGVVTSITFDLYGCIQALVGPTINDKGEIPERQWFDLKRLQIVDRTPVMVQPIFSVVPGGQDHPQQIDKPLP